MAWVWLIAALAVGLAGLKTAPGLAVPWLLIVPATILRSSAILVHRRGLGRVGKALGVADVFFGSAWRVCAVVLASAIGFVAVCIPTGCVSLSALGSNYTEVTWFVIAVFAGGLAASFVLATLGRRMLPPKD